MNKDFEKEYKELAEIEAPDLWDRIEAGITEKEIIKETTPETGKKKTVLSFAKRYSLPAAALLCAVMIIPALNLMRNSSGKSMTYESAADRNSSAAADTCAPEEAADEFEVAAAVTAEEPVADAGGASMADISETAPMESNAMKDTVSDDSASIAGNSVSDEKYKMQKEEAAGGTRQEAESSRETEEQKLTDIVVKVTEAKNRLDGDSTLDEAGTFYTAVVQKDPSGTLAEGEQILIFIPAYSSFGLVKEGVFELDLAMNQNTDDFYTVAGYGRQIEE